MLCTATSRESRGSRRVENQEGRLHMVHAHFGLTTEKSYTLARAFSDLEEARLGPWYGRQMEE